MNMTNTKSQNEYSHKLVANSISEAVGNVPYIKLNRIHSLCLHNSFYVKMDSCNPTGSIKDKNAAFLIDQAEKQGLLKQGGTIIESSSGNFGMSLASIGASKGYQVIIVIDAKTPPPVIKMLNAYGAALEEVPLSLADSAGSMQKARMAHAKKLADTMPNSFYPCQHLNPDNPLAHYYYTAFEIANAFPKLPDAIVIGISTAGQLSGIARYFRSHSPTTKIIAVDVAGSGIFGKPRHPYKMTGLGLSFVPPAFQPSDIDYAYNVTDQMAFSMCHHLGKREGLLLGASTGAIVSAGLAYAIRAKVQHEKIILINPDRADRYLDTVYNPDWLAHSKISLYNDRELDTHIKQLDPVYEPHMHGEGVIDAIS
ncbi:PLP-dependent cysteine synthase family protein [Vibrio hepatarius]|uniref:PLP-dependent cysteine synthase family protein n=1 Tax=Vibrio hepatarius TaxID=171383 RepID=UPI001C084840|nr:PLP-dependent cysteine synthase family protein [Vibrio hepatarius]MBU2898747.1 PLP-dependent cysteine synthase family protein [Vibrio hepatarius]